MRIRCRPISTFPAEFEADSRSNSFSAGWSSTLALLQRELAMLHATEVVIELAVSEDEIRLDGWPKASARPAHPGVAISFDSSHGPLRYGTNAFPHWQANVRAIALGLEALRKVERYGIGKRGEQYVGWRQLESGEGFRTVGEARDFLCELADWTRGTTGGATSDRALVAAALKRAHPDTGGDAETFERVQQARKLLTG